MLFSCQNQVQQPSGIDLEKSARKNEELHRAPLGMGSCGCVVSGSHILPFVVSSPVRNSINGHSYSHITQTGNGRVDSCYHPKSRPASQCGSLWNPSEAGEREGWGDTREEATRVPVFLLLNCPTTFSENPIALQGGQKPKQNWHPGTG